MFNMFIIIDGNFDECCQSECKHFSFNIFIGMVED